MSVYQFLKAYFIFLFCFISFALYAQESALLENVIDTSQATQEAALSSQQKINSLSLDTEKLLAQYRHLSRRRDNLEVESKHLEAVLGNQSQEKQALEQQLEDIKLTQNEITPLILQMLSNLEKFISLDLPFLTEERKQRLNKLQAMMLRADVNTAEKFRRILEAYQIENEYGNSIEAYTDTLDLNGTQVTVNVLRLGRVALYYQHLDQSETGFWNKAEKRWQTLPSRYRNSIRDGLRIARKESAPNLLTLPIVAAEAVK